MEPQGEKYQPLVIRHGRRFGWWIEGRKSNGRRYMFTWWPTKGIAGFVARTWAALLRGLGGADVRIEMQEPPDRPA
jgi:hypothetical protein